MPYKIEGQKKWKCAIGGCRYAKRSVDKVFKHEVKVHLIISKLVWSTASLYKKEYFSVRG